MRRTFSVWKLLVCNLPLLCAWLVLPAIALGQATGFAVDAQLPDDLQGCLSAEALQASYLHALAANGIQRTGESSLVVIVRTRANAEPGSTLLELSARVSGRALGRSQLHVKTTDCDVLPRMLGQALARLARQTAAADANKPLLPLPAGTFQSSDASGGSEPSDFIVVGAGAGVVTGMLPSAAFALQLQAATPNYPLSMRLKALLLWPQQNIMPEGIIDTRAYELSLELCGSFRLPSWQRLALRLCLGPRIGLEGARGRNFPVYNAHPTSLFGYLGLTPEVALQLATQTWLQLGAGVALGIVRPHFLLGIDSARRSVELSNPAAVRSELSASLLQVF